MVPIGMLIVLVSVFGGYILHHGEIGVLIQPAEFIIIGGAALGALLISTPMSVVIKLIKSLMKVLTGGGVSKVAYVELLSLIYDLGQTIKKDGQLALESHMENAHSSSIFSKYPTFLKNHHAVDFLADTGRVIIMGGVPPYEIEALMDADLEVHHQEEAAPVAVLQKIGDAMPGLGIVAAVLGIVITMQAIDGPPAEIGLKVAAALVGTFLGILIAYGFLQPLASIIETINASEARYFECLKAGLLALARSMPPQIAVEFARRTITSDVRPTFKDMESTLRGKK
jgi:chemotaxis protein MotA